MECGFLNSNINGCDTPLNMFKPLSWLINYDYINKKSIVLSGVKCLFELDNGYAIEVIDRSDKPFDGFKIESEKAARTVFHNYDKFTIYANSADSANTIKALSSESRWVRVLEQIDTGEEDENRFVVIGLRGGMSLNAAVSDCWTDKAWDVELISKNNTAPVLFFGGEDFTAQDIYDKSIWAGFNSNFELNSSLGVETGMDLYLANYGSGIGDDSGISHIKFNNDGSIVSSEGNYNANPNSYVLDYTYVGLNQRCSLAINKFVATPEIKGFNGSIRLRRNGYVSALINSKISNVDFNTESIYLYNCLNLKSLKEDGDIILDFRIFETGLESINTNASDVTLYDNNLLETLTCYKANRINYQQLDTSNTILSNVSCKNAYYIDLKGCALTSVCIESILFDLLALNTVEGKYLRVDGGANADINTWSINAIAYYNQLISEDATIVHNGTL